MRYSATAPVKIIVLGAGGTGGYLIPHLYRIAFANAERAYRVIICDGDIVEPKNLIRQNFIEQDIGRNKAAVLAGRYAGAFGMECEYIPEYIESEQRLKELVQPDFVKASEDKPEEAQQVILLGCVDNNKSRAICHKVFYNTDNLVYIDSGNGEHTGQVVCGARRDGRTVFKPIGKLYPDVLNAEDKLPTELSCAERAVSAPQSVTANLTAATAVTSFLYDLLIAGSLTTRYVTFSSKIISTRAETVKKRKRRTEKMRGIEIPAGAENKKNNGGFYVANSAVFTTDNPTRDWDVFIAFLDSQLSKAMPELEIVKRFENVTGGRRTYVFAESDRMKIILDGQEEYIAVFLVADDSTEALVFNTALNTLKHILLFGYKGSVFRRINYRRLSEVKDERL